MRARRSRAGGHRHVHGLHCDHGHGDAHDHGPAADLRRIETLARHRYRLESFTPIRVEELATTEPGFPPRETRILFWSGNDAQHQHRIFKPAKDVTIEDLPPWWYKDALILDEFPYCDCCG